MAAKLQRIERELGELADMAERRELRPEANPDAAESGAHQEVRGEAEDEIFERETSKRQEVR
jgi:hypothetical protein